MYNCSIWIKLEESNSDFRHCTFLCTRFAITFCAFLSDWRYLSIMPENAPSTNLTLQFSVHKQVLLACVYLNMAEIQVLIFKHLTSASVRYSRDSLFFRRWASSTIIAPHGMEDKKASSFKHNYKERKGLQLINISLNQKLPYIFPM